MNQRTHFDWELPSEAGTDRAKAAARVAFSQLTPSEFQGVCRVLRAIAVTAGQPDQVDSLQVLLTEADCMGMDKFARLNLAAFRDLGAAVEVQ